MARPQKEGIDYFPLDVDMDHDDKIQLIEAEHGIMGFGIIIKLLMKIYAEGYYYQWSEKEQLLFSNRTNVDINQVNAVINSCIKWGMFDREVYEKHKILTSSGIQRRYVTATSRRKYVQMIREYTLIDVESASNIVIVNINGVNVNNNATHDEFMPEKTPQSKVKKSKVKKSKDICAPDGARAHTAPSPGGSVEAEKVTATPDGNKLSEKSGPRSPFKSKRQEQLFDEFWAQYPKKRSKGQAEKTWVKIKPDEQLFKAIMAGLERAKTSVDWQKDGGQFIPYPSTWLNAKGWEDEYKTTAEVNSNAQHRGCTPKPSAFGNRKPQSNRFAGLVRDGGTGRIAGQEDSPNAG